MQPDGAVRNRQAQTRAPGLPVASVVEPVKGLKNLFQRFLGNPRAGIEHANHYLIAFSLPATARCRSSRTSTVVPSAV